MKTLGNAVSRAIFALLTTIAWVICPGIPAWAKLAAITCVGISNSLASAIETRAGEK